MASLLQGTKYLRKADDDSKLPLPLSEKIMLAVTGVNECAYCSFLHTQTALEKGVSQSEIEDLLNGTLGGFDEREAPALLYAQHWADTYGNASVPAREKLTDFYGSEKALQIEGYIRLVYMGNMCSNTVVFFEDKNIPRAEKVGLLPTYLLCKPIAASIRNRGMKLAGKRT
jgi:AhpD family alkylhydroperoxidase